MHAVDKQRGEEEELFKKRKIKKKEKKINKKELKKRRIRRKEGERLRRGRQHLGASAQGVT